MITDTTEGRHLVANPYFLPGGYTGQQLPYISEQDEIYVNDNEVRMLKLVNGEVITKRSPAACHRHRCCWKIRKKGIHGRPEAGITHGRFGFNVTHEDEAKRAVFGDLSFRRRCRLRSTGMN